MEGSISVNRFYPLSKPPHPPVLNNKQYQTGWNTNLNYMKNIFDIIFDISFFCFLPKLKFQHHLHKINITFYLLTWTYFNDANVGRNILINAQLKRILFMSSNKKKWNKTEEDRKNMEKENNTNKSDFSENRYQI